MHFYCSACGKIYPISSYAYQCECGGLFKLHKTKDEKIPITVSLGEVRTPILKKNLQGREVYLKLDYMNPTGSFKDRGAFIMINKLKELGITEVVEDSSGNAGAAIAGYCASAGIKCNIYLPESTSTGKIKQISAYKANIVKIPGTRDDVSEAYSRQRKKHIMLHMSIIHCFLKALSLLPMKFMNKLVFQTMLLCLLAMELCCLGSILVLKKSENSPVSLLFKVMIVHLSIANLIIS